jgi:hypothetical protein
MEQAIPMPPQPLTAGQHVRGGVVTFAVNVIESDQGKAVVLRIEGANGSFVFPIDPATAIKVGSQLREHGRNAKSGLVVPQVLPPDGRLNGLG